MILLNKLFSAEKSAKGRVDYPLLLLGAVIYGLCWRLAFMCSAGIFFWELL